MATQEPQLASLNQPLVRYFSATRPAFLSVTLVAALLGLAACRADHLPVDPLKALLTILFALVAHAGANVLNDYYDALNGSDAANQQRLFPFTGGSRFIQNGVLSLQATRRFGYALLALVVPAGLWLTWHSASGLVLIGLSGLLLAWAYSAPPLQLMARAAGELAIMLGWLLVVVGTDYVQRGAFAARPWIVGLPLALLVTAILYLNQFPDVQADRLVGKRTLVVRLGVRRARWGLSLLCTSAYLWLCVALLQHRLPYWAVISLASAPLSWHGCRSLLRSADQPELLTGAIRATIAAANLHGLLLALTLFCLS
jgi:1,4-dihydroxy-2-naphthoate octaprenyltransferase